MASPETSTKPGAFVDIRRNGEILVCVARFPDNNTVALRTGGFGKSLADGLKSLNKKSMPLYDQYEISCGSPNRFCLEAACLRWGGREMEGDYFLTEADFCTWSTHDFDKYTAPSGRTMDPRARSSQHIEIWGINAVNMSRMFAAVYGAELLQERLGAIERLRPLHVGYHHKYTLLFVRSAWGALAIDGFGNCAT